MSLQFVPRLSGWGNLGFLCHHFLSRVPWSVTIMAGSHLSPCLCWLFDWRSAPYICSQPVNFFGHYFFMWNFLRPKTVCICLSPAIMFPINTTVFFFTLQLLFSVLSCYLILLCLIWQVIQDSYAYTLFPFITWMCALPGILVLKGVFQ